MLKKIINFLLGSTGRLTKSLVAIGIALLVFFKWDAVLDTWEYGLNEWKSYEETAPQKDNSPSTIPVDLPDNRSTESSKGADGIGRFDHIQSLKVASWNMCNIGISKSDEEITFIADLLKGFDIVAVQEISTKLSGPRAIVKLNEQLNRKGHAWDYVISNPTTGEGAERYAYLWKTAKTSLTSKPWLVSARNLDDKIDREPFMGRFYLGDDKLLIANFHAVPSSKKPEYEAVLLDELHRVYSKDNLVVLGDFNLSQKSEAFDELEGQGYKPALINQKTSIRRIKSGDNYLAQEYDNIFYETKVLQMKRSGIVDFVPQFESLKEARQISDHLPIWAELAISAER